MNLTTRVGFSTSKSSWISKIIRWFTRSKVSHTFLIYYDQDFSRDMVMEATEGGFRIVPFDQYTKGADYLRVFMPRQSIDYGVLIAVDWLGQHYDYAGLIGMMWVMLCRWFKRKVHNPLHSSGTMFCSTAVTMVLQAAKYINTEKFDPASTNPEDLEEFCIVNMDEMVSLRVGSRG